MNNMINHLHVSCVKSDVIISETRDQTVGSIGLPKIVSVAKSLTLNKILRCILYAVALTFVLKQTEAYSKLCVV